MSEILSRPTGRIPEISVENVSKIYGEGPNRVEAISHADFTIQRGDFVSILGPSGCGKSTLLNAIGGLELPSTGRVAIHGDQVAAPRRDVGIIFQDSVLLPWKTVMENILFPVQVMGLSPGAHINRARQLLDSVGLTGFADKRPRELSGGMRQRAAICRGLVHDPKVLLMDEPFSALDTITRDHMSVILMELWQKFPRTAVFVTHSIREAVLLSDRVLVMGRRPSRVIADIRINLPRPRPLSVTESPEFNEYSAQLRDLIESAHGYEDEAIAPATKEVPA